MDGLGWVAAVTAGVLIFQFVLLGALMMADDN